MRNPNWDEASDQVRKAYPDKIVDLEGIQTETVVQRIMADSGNDKIAVTQGTAPPALQAQIQSNPQVKARSTNPAAPYVDYLVPNFTSKVMANDKARMAFAMATDKDAYITAQGGPTAADPTNAMINKALAGYKQFDTTGVPSAGDPAKAKALLQQSGLTLPVPITVAYRKRPTQDKALSAMAETWNKAGFKVTLNGIAQNYYPTVQNPSQSAKFDVMWAGWGADWPSGSTVIPPLFDSRLNLSADSTGQDYGWFKDDAINKPMDAALGSRTPPRVRRRGVTSTRPSRRRSARCRWSTRSSCSSTAPVSRTTPTTRSWAATSSWPRSRSSKTSRTRTNR